MQKEITKENIKFPTINGNIENRSSIEVVKNSKGYNWSLKRYYKDTEQINEVLKEIQDTEQKLKEKFGGGSE